MDRYQELKEYVKDYLEHMDELNEKKIACNEKELEFLRKESVCFNLLQKNFLRMEAEDVIPEDQQSL